MAQLFQALSLSTFALTLAVAGFGQSSGGKLVPPKPERTVKSEIKKEKPPVKKREGHKQIEGSLPEEPFAPMPVVGMPFSRSMMENGSGIASAGGFLYVLNGSMIYKINASDLKVIQVKDLRLGNNGLTVQSSNRNEPDELLNPAKKPVKKKPKPKAGS